MTYDDHVRNAENKVFTDDPEILKMTDYRGQSVAHEQARYGWTTECRDILMLADRDGTTVAHVQAYEGWTTEDQDILVLSDMHGLTVAHNQARFGWVTEDRGILKLATSFGWTVAHAQAYDEFFDEFMELHMADGGWRMTNCWDVLEMTDTDRWTTDDPELLKMATKRGLTVAHVQAFRGWTTEDPVILKMADADGETVALVQARYGWTTEDPEIRELLGVEMCRRAEEIRQDRIRRTGQ
jgi:hypothetical protein